MQRRARIFRLNGAATSSVRAGKVNQALKDSTYIFACGTLPSVINDPLNTRMEEIVFWPGGGTRERISGLDRDSLKEQEE